MDSNANSGSDETIFRLLSSADLDNVRPRVEELYIQQNVSLKDVARIIHEETGINVSVQMYKKKLARWGVRKGHFQWQKNKLQPKPQDQQSVQEDILVLPGVTQDRNDTNARGQRLQRRRARGRVAAGPSHAVRNRRGLFDSGVRQLSSTTPNSPDAYQWREQVIKLTYDIQCEVMEPLVLPEGVFDTPLETDPTDSPVVIRRRELARLGPLENAFRGSIFTAMTLIQERQYSAAGAALERTFRAIGPVLKTLTPAILPSMLICLHGIVFAWQARGITRMLARYLFHYCWRAFGPSHKLTIWTRALFLNPDPTDPFLLAIEAASAATSTIAGRYDSWSLLIRYGLLEANPVKSGPALQDVYRKHEELLRDCQYLYPPKPRIALKTRQSLATRISTYDGDHARAESILSDVPNLIHQTYPNEMDTFTVLAAAHDLATYIAKQGGVENILRAEKVRRESLARAKVLLGKDHVLTTYLYKELGKLYEEIGRMDDAQEQYQDMLEVLREYQLGGQDKEDFGKERDQRQAYGEDEE